MDEVLSAPIFGATLLAGMLLLLEAGRRLGVAWIRRNPEAGRTGLDVVEGAIFALFGLLTAFTFSGAGSRVDSRRQLIVEEANAIGTCHSRRTELGDYDHRRSELLDNHPPVLLSEGLYYPGGQILDEDFEYGSFIQSKMFRMGVRCTDCHDAHTLKLRKEGNGVCLQCHSAPAYDGARHHFHKKEWQGRESAGALCVSCHMPKCPFMVIHLRADHSIRIPRPDLTKDIGVPNACSRCHSDKPLSWAGAAYDKWYGTARKPHYGTVLAAGRRAEPAAKADLLRLAGDRLTPTVVRATALSLLGRYRAADVTAAFRAALLDEEPLIRRTAVAEAPIEDEAERVSRLAPLLSDPFRAVRLEAASLLVGTPAARLRPYQQDALATAIADYVKAMEYSLDFSSAGHNLGLLYERLGDLAKAEAYYRRCGRRGRPLVPA